MAESSRCLIAVPVKTTLRVIVLPSQCLPSDPFYETETERIVEECCLEKAGKETVFFHEHFVQLRHKVYDKFMKDISVSLLSFLKQDIIA